MALESEADELYYGGGAGGGKSDLLLGYGLSRSHSGIIFRRQFKQLEGPEGLIERSKRIVGRSDRFNGSRMIWRLGDRMLEFGAVDHEDDKEKYQGRAHDFKGFDEISQFTESQYVYLTAWARTTVHNQRVRVIACGNPPQNAEGEWVIQRWAPWLDEAYSQPALPGELRWFAMIDGQDTEVDGPESFVHSGEILQPSSRTFIPARVTDNPYLLATDYVRQLQRMPEPLRSQLLFGDHTVGLQDAPWQVIPTAWVRAAQARWTPSPPRDVPLMQIGFDVAQGGADNTVIARRYGPYFAALDVIPGVDVPDAKVNADHVTRAMADGGIAQIDADGIGSSTYFLARALVGHRIRAYQGSAPTKWRDKPKVLTFINTRAAAWWALRQALDPSSGENLALPTDRTLRVELCAPTWEKQTNGVKIEAKKDIKERLGRSPDMADAVVMAFWSGKSALSGAFASAPQTATDPTREPDPLQGASQIPPARRSEIEDWPTVAVTQKPPEPQPVHRKRYDEVKGVVLGEAL